MNAFQPANDRRVVPLFTRICSICSSPARATH